MRNPSDLQLANQGSHSQAVENEKKGIGNLLGGGFKDFFNKKKTASMKSGGKAPSQKGSAGATSCMTDLSDVEKLERIMNEAKYASKGVAKYFGKLFEEYRRHMNYQKEIVFSDLLMNNPSNCDQPQD